MTTIEKTIEVDVPIRTAYNQWTQFEDFPRFMEGVKEVHQLDDKHLHWRAELMGKEVEWNSEITHQVPDQRISWRSTSGAQNTGSISFLPLTENRTQVTLHMVVDPEGAAQATGSALGLVSSRIEGDLKRFKDFIEKRGAETGEWRGEIQGQQVIRETPGNPR
jgi:uncharacterized membrane protein